MDDDDEEGYDYFAPEVVEARDAVGKAVTAYIDLIRKDDTPYVVAWAVAAEWTSTELEQNGQAGRDVISPSEQSISATCGLGHYVVSRFA